MRAHRIWPVLLGTVGSACATAVSLDETGSPSDYPDGSFTGPDSASSAGGNQPVETGGYAYGYGGTNTGSGGAGSGNTSSSGGRVSSGGASQGGAGGVSKGGSGGTIASGGRTATGGTVASGGVTASGGTSSTGGTSTDAGSCKNGQKLCGGVCVAPAPSNGCGLTGCTACPGPPPNGGVLACDNTAHACSFVCLSGYTKQGDQCVSSTGGGGSSGAGGSTGGCVPSVCPKCCFGAEPGCCASPTSCGCPIVCIPGTCG